ncbi:hypothetical protein [Porphyromonas sp.]|uniref:hypothetical protein n=1 Tax=Porphyromonas sp. TaxID=1924944 RepID=UPI0026DBFD4E|nr:hypothetical protein [Porphyromonas sp.]MDO4771644.1 hypothetical protein [Porphyromonas sp.]
MNAKILMTLVGLFLSFSVLSQTPAQQRLVKNVQAEYQAAKGILAKIDKTESDLPEPVSIGDKSYDVIRLDDIKLAYVNSPYPKLNVSLYFEFVAEGDTRTYRPLMAIVSKKDVPMHSLYQEYLFKDGALRFAFDYEACCGGEMRYYVGKDVEYIKVDDPEEEISQESVDTFRQNAMTLIELLDMMMKMSHFGI